MAKSISLSWIKGDTERLYFIVREDDTAISLTGYDVWCTLKASYTDADDAATSIQKRIGSGITLTNHDVDGVLVTEGLITITFTAADTKTLTPGKAYQYDVQIKTPDGDIKTLVTGQVTVGNEVTLADAYPEPDPEP